MPPSPTSLEDDRTTVVAIIAAGVLGATLVLGYTIVGVQSGTTDPVVALLFGSGLTASTVLGVDVLARAPVLGQSKSLLARKVEHGHPRMVVVVLTMTALLLFGTAAMGIHSEFVVRTEHTGTLSLVNIGIQTTGGTVLATRALWVATRG
ncbi:MAG: hypothetical protein ACOCYZ_01410 [Halococcoides sp.]